MAHHTRILRHQQVLVCYEGIHMNASVILQSHTGELDALPHHNALQAKCLSFSVTPFWHATMFPNLHKTQKII